jgi:hypothetical protein
MARAYKVGENLIMFTCPGCGIDHGVTVNAARNSEGSSWEWNGSLDLPTFTPSIKCSWGGPQVCHSFVRDGRIQFLPDCFHNLKGQTVDLPEQYK